MRISSRQCTGRGAGEGGVGGVEVHCVHCVQGVELEKVEFFCEALGSPQPTYTWLDKDGLDATQKLGKGTLANHITFVQYSL